MSLTSKSPRTVAIVALEVGKRTLPAYAHRFAPKTFTQPQLFACIVLKTFFRTDYRGAEQYLKDLPELQRVLGLPRVPDHSTLHKAARRLFGKALTDRMLDASVQMSMHARERIDRLAVDSSGFEARHVSRYFVRRRKRDFKTTNLYQTTTYRRWPKLAIAADCDTHLIVSLKTMRGPNPDIRHIESVVEDAWMKWAISTVYADAGYDGEWVHTWLREDLGANSLIPAKVGRPTSKPPSGRWRRWMAGHLHETDYGQRWQVETVFSMIKRNLGESVNAITYWSQSRAMRLLAITHNIMILYGSRGFRRSMSGTVYPSDSDFFGLPYSLNVDSRLNCFVILSRHWAAPKGWPGFTARHSASNSASLCGVFTRSSQPGGRRPPATGQGESNAFSRAVPACQRCRLDQCQSSARHWGSSTPYPVLRFGIESAIPQHMPCIELT